MSPPPALGGTYQRLKLRYRPFKPIERASKRLWRGQIDTRLRSELVRIIRIARTQHAEIALTRRIAFVMK
jgi:hypothetical protein